MAHLTKPTRYNIEDSNIALLGSDLEKHVREHAGDTEAAWVHAGSAPGLQVWRIEQFNVVEWPSNRIGTFYEGDSYIVLHTYKKTQESEVFSYDLHFWLGDQTTQDEAGTAAYKTVELDDHLHGVPVQYREVQHSESQHFLSYFPRFLSLKGGAPSGFHHVTISRPVDAHKLYRVGSHSKGLVVREVQNLTQGDVYVLDKGTKVWQLNTQGSSGKERFRAAEFARGLLDDRGEEGEVTVYDEGSRGSSAFLSEFGLSGTTLPANPSSEPAAGADHTLYRISDASGPPTFTPVTTRTLDSTDAFLLDAADAVYVWLGRDASITERRLAGEYAQRFLHQGNGTVRKPVIKMNEGRECEAFWEALGYRV